MTLEKTLLMIPGPVNVSPRVLRAMAKPVINHRSPEFGKRTLEINEMLKKVFKTNNDIIILTSSGTGGVEAALANTIKAGDKVLVCVNGAFGERARNIAEVYNADIIDVNADWGKAISSKDVKEKLTQDTKAVVMVYNETSTGVQNPIGEVGEIVKQTNTLFIVDAISGLGGHYVGVDEFGIDICVVGSQKCLAAPPGLAFVSISSKAWKVIELNKPRSLYFDLVRAKSFLQKDPPQTPFTPAVSTFYGLHEALKIVEEEGLENWIKRHEIIAKATREGIKAMGLELFADEKVASNTVTPIKYPAGINDKEFRKTMRTKYLVEVAGGQKQLSGKIFRIGHLGTVTSSDIISTLSAVEMAMNDFGIKIEPGVGLSAAQRVFRG
ncbi:MAG: alanine--glyoxylate aminotransferase family protein [Euryarchaeota archaeon]|nr:alanine--glyoxylate aminotransferase family protein [Euryarchaeota archaeon]